MATHWSDDVRSAEDMVRYKDRFLADPGCMADFEAIGDELGGDVASDVLLSEWFDCVVDRLSDESFALHRHMSVPNVEAFVDGLRDGSLEPGNHWSLNPTTWSPSPERTEREVMLTATVERGQVDWYSTLQSYFAHPWENEVVFEGPARLKRLVDLDNQTVHEFNEPATVPSMG